MLFYGLCMVSIMAVPRVSPFCPSAVCVWTFPYLAVLLYDHIGVIFQYIRACSDQGKLLTALPLLIVRQVSTNYGHLVSRVFGNRLSHPR